MSESQNNTSPIASLPLLASMVAITPLAIDMYLPAMPAISQALGSSSSIIQISLSLFLAGYALGMMIFGPLADRVGRKKVAVIGLIGFISCSLLLAITDSSEYFLLLRFLQASFGSGVTVVVPGVIRDMYGKDTAKGLSYVGMIMMIAPLIAPAIGSFILELASWSLIFVTLAAYGTLLLVLIIFKFPNRLPTRSERNWIQEFANNYQLVFKDKSSVLNIISSMFGSFAFFSYLTSISFIYIEYFSVSEGQFSLFFGVNVVALLIANIYNSRRVVQKGSRAMLLLGVSIALGFAIILLLVSLQQLSLYWTVAMLFPIIGSLSLITVNSDSLVLTKFPQQTGTATAVIGTLRFASGALAGPILAVLFNGTPFNLIILLVISLSVVLIAQLLNRSQAKLQTEK